MVARRSTAGGVSTRKLLIIAALLTATAPAQAKEGYLVLSVRSLDDRPMANVRIGTRGPGTTVASDIQGRIMLRLAPQTRVGDIVTVQVVPPPDYVLVSPLHGRLAVPCFNNETDCYLDVEVMPPGDPRALEHASVLLRAASPRRSRAGRTSSLDGAAGAMPAYYMTVAFQPQVRPAAPPLHLVDPMAAAELGFAPAQIEAAMARFSSDRMAWKVTLLTAHLEFGNLDPFATITPDFSRPDVSFGIGSWNFQTNLLQAVLARMRSAAPARFDAIMGNGAPLVARLIQTRGSDAAQLAARAMVDGRQIREPWKSRFRRLGVVPAFQRIQFEALQPFVNTARNWTVRLGFRSEHAFAFVYDLLYNSGASVLRSPRLQNELDGFRAEFGRQPDERERMLIIANLANRSPLTARFPQIAARRLAMATGRGRVFGQDIDLEELGLGMQDFATGDPVPIADDPAVLERLKSGRPPAAPQPLVAPTPVGFATPAPTPDRLSTTVMSMTNEIASTLSAFARPLFAFSGTVLALVTTLTMFEAARWLRLRSRAQAAAAMEIALHRAMVYGLQQTGESLRELGWRDDVVRGKAIAAALQYLNDHYPEALRRGNPDQKAQSEALIAALPGAVAALAAAPTMQN